jgi:hypothetical protein
MSDKNMFDEAFPQHKQIGGSHYQHYLIQPYEFISKNELTFFQGNVIKYVLRYPYKRKNKLIMCEHCKEWVAVIVHNYTYYCGDCALFDQKIFEGRLIEDANLSRKIQ